MRAPQHSRTQSGFTLIEVLVTLVILLLGLLGLVGLQAKAQLAETESYQRTQALMLLRDVADRVNANRTAAAADSYLTGTLSTATPSSLGTGSTKDCSAPATTADIDLCGWDASLKGAAELSGTNKVGAMLGARGCITKIAANLFLIQVVWQGLSATAAPPASVACGSGQYDASDLTRRAVTSVVQIGTLT